MANLKFIRNLSIKNKITCLIVFVAFTVISIGFLFISFWDMKRMKTEILSQLIVDAKLVGDYCIVPLVFGDKQQASMALSRLKFIESVEEGYLLDESGMPFSVYPDSIEVHLADLSVKKESAVFRDNYFIITEPVSFEDQVIGTLIIKANSLLMKDQNRKLAIILSFMFLCMLIISFLMASRLQKLITAPILKLAETTASISRDQNFDVHLEAEKYGNNEIGVLYHQFNNLLFQLSRKERERDEAVKEITFLAHVLKNIRENITITDTNDNITFVNQAFLKTYGYTEQEIIGKNISIIRSPDNLSEVVDEILPSTLKGGWQGELMNRKKDGTDFPILLSTTVIYDPDNNPIALVGICSDITERKKLQEDLMSHQNHLEELVVVRTEKLNVALEETRDLYENAPCGYHSLNTDGVFVRINSTELKWLGYSRDEIIGHLAFTDLLKPEGVEKYNESVGQLIREGTLSNVEFEITRKDGTTFFASSNTTAVFDPEGTFIESRSSLFDISDRKRAEEALSKAIDEAEKANQAKSEFLANMSHEIRTPMNAVLGYTELLGSLLDEEIQKNYIESIRSSGRSLLTLINDILDLSKIEAGKLELEYEYVDSNSFFMEFEKIFALKASEKGINLIVEIDSGTPSGIYIDEPRLRQIVFNLIGNAIKFTDQGYVKLRVHTDNLQLIKSAKNRSEELIDLIIEVKDTGIGMSKITCKEIFDPFIQSKDQKKMGGTGLGLAITRRLTLLMNGTINLKSEPTKGSTFTVTIPGIAFKRDFVSLKITPEFDLSRVVFQPATILVVDDVAHNRNYIRDSLKNTEIKVYEADEGSKALDIAKKVVPDLIISDIRMPRMDGFELLSSIKEDNTLKDIPVLAYSASVLKEQKERIHQSNFAGLLSKPLNVKELYSELMNFLPFREDKGKMPVSQIEEVSDSEIINLTDLILSLETTFTETWLSFKKRQAIGEIRLFAENLASLGNAHNSTIISRYGNDLVNAADSFNIETILMLLKQFPSQIEHLKTLK